eukprot:358027-Chlamydomonas_euryale.AAC.2
MPMTVHPHMSPAHHSVDELRYVAEKYGPIKDIYMPKDYYTSECAPCTGCMVCTGGVQHALAGGWLPHNHEVLGCQRYRRCLEIRRGPLEGRCPEA